MPLFSQYKHFAVNNRATFQTLETFLSLNTYLLISPNHEIRSQYAYTLLMLWSLVHDELIWKTHEDTQFFEKWYFGRASAAQRGRDQSAGNPDSLKASPSMVDFMSQNAPHVIDSAPVQGGDGPHNKQYLLDYVTLDTAPALSKPSPTSQPPTPKVKALKNDERLPNQKWVQLLKLIEYVEVLLEMIIQKRAGKRNKWYFILLIELAKSMIKTIHVLTAKSAMYLHHSVIPSKRDLWLKETNWKQLRGARTTKVLPQHPSYQLFLPPSLLDFLKSPWHRSLWYFSEFLYIFRPVIYVLLIIHFYYHSKRRSVGLQAYKRWLPWIISLLMDLTSLKLSQYLASKSEYNAATMHAELTRRRQNLLSYLVRNPCFKVFIKPFVQWMCNKLKNIPLINFLSTNIVEYLLTLQSYYFYTAAS